MGDNLEAAREFVSRCTHDISRLISGKIDAVEAADILGSIETAAGEVNARAISRIARQTREELNFKWTEPAQSGNLLALNKLVTQYEAGLSEVESTNRVKDDETRHSDQAAFDLAAANLTGLLKYSQSAPERRALEGLIRFGGGKLPLAPEFDLLDNVTANITDGILRSARQSEKSVSISTACDNVRLTKDQLSKLETMLVMMGQELVRDSVDTPDVRASRGQSRSAHIALTATQQDDKVHILIACEGKEPSRRILTAPETYPLRETGMQAGMSCESGKINIALADISASGKPKFENTSVVSVGAMEKSA